MKAGMGSEGSDESNGVGVAGVRRREGGAWRPRARTSGGRRRRVNGRLTTRIVGLGYASRGTPNPVVVGEKRRRTGGADSDAG